jgi:hypothetical protein
MARSQWAQESSGRLRTRAESLTFDAVTPSVNMRLELRRAVQARAIRFVVVLGALLAAAGACRGPGASRQAGTDPYLILAAELEKSSHHNLYDAVRQLRPSWYTRTVQGRRGENAIAIYVENQMIGTLSALRRISVFGTEQVRYINATEAQTRYGQSNGGRAAIVVELEKH